VNLPLITRAQEHNQRIAILVPFTKRLPQQRGCTNATASEAFTYGDLLYTSSQIATNLLQDAEDLQEERVAFLVPPGFEYVATLWGIWRDSCTFVYFSPATRIGVYDYNPHSALQHVA
jgi:malonyl-CoA/methylmalonyl-CoA synthetase